MSSLTVISWSAASFWAMASWISDRSSYLRGGEEDEEAEVSAMVFTVSQCHSVSLRRSGGGGGGASRECKVTVTKNPKKPLKNHSFYSFYSSFVLSLSLRRSLPSRSFNTVA